jgi:LysM repeat protein
MTKQQIREYYDNHPNMTLAQLSAKTGVPVPTLKSILMSS